MTRFTELETLLWEVASAALPFGGDAVRFTHQPEGAPDWDAAECVCFIRVEPASGHDYASARDVTVGGDGGGGALELVSDYTRVYDAHFAVFGPDAPDNADLLRHSLHLPDARYELGHAGFFLVPEIAQPALTRVCIRDTWVPRCDFSARCYEAARRTDAVAAIGRADVQRVDG